MTVTKNILQFEYNIFDPDNENQQIHYLQSKNYRFIQTPIYSFKIRRNEDRVCSLFYNLLKHEQDFDSLLLMLSLWGKTERTFPTFLGFGTITSRIILRQPSLQNISKTNRDVIVADVGKKLLYIDYSQFEAGVLASLSKDNDLIALYNTDIYSDLAEKVLNDRSKRSDAKVIFYRYMYGDDTLNKVAKSYFSRFKNLVSYKNQINSQITQNKKVGCLFANYRFSLNKETSWGLSHIIQSTASLIYKNAILAVKNELPNVEFVIPMHDATLYQISNTEFERYKNAIQEIYKREFQAICPDIIPQVVCHETFV